MCVPGCTSFERNVRIWIIIENYGPWNLGPGPLEPWPLALGPWAPGPWAVQGCDAQSRSVGPSFDRSFSFGMMTGTIREVVFSTRDLGSHSWRGVCQVSTVHLAVSVWPVVHDFHRQRFVASEQDLGGHSRSTSLRGKLHHIITAIVG